jgi:arylformamidase
MTWKKWSHSDLEKQFNPRAAIGEGITKILAGWESASAGRRVELKGEFDIAYGDHPLMQYDCHVKSSDKLIIINIHGGYFRAFDKSGMDSHVADLLKSGFGVVNINYPLCPEVTLTSIVKTLGVGISHVMEHLEAQGFNQKIVLLGHSAGAHLGMHLSHEPAIKKKLVGIVALSGVFELGFIQQISIQDDVHLSDDEVKKLDCLNFPPSLGPKYYISAGGDEPSAWIDQSWIMANFLTKRGDDVTLHICSGAHHFNLVDYLCDGNHLDGLVLKKWIVSLYDE